MKKIITITAIFIVAIGTAHAQQRIDTSKRVNLTQSDIWAIHGIITQTIQKLHKIDMSSLKRDSLDSYLGSITSVIEERYKRAKVDTVKGGKK